MQQKTKYGLGQQDFKVLREGGFEYIDKTQFIIPLLEGAGFYFLSRPRRFGKSLFISTLNYFFKGDKDLFKGLSIESYDWDWEEYPIIRFDFSSGSFSRADGLQERMLESLEWNESRYGIKPKEGSPRARLHKLILQLKEKFGKGVVILVDEYEKPLLDSMMHEHFEDYRIELADFYSVLKADTPNIRFLFMTGITRFGHLNIFSGLNNLNDISLDEKYDELCGISDDELKNKMNPGVSSLANKNGWSEEKTLKALKEFFDGYHFSRRLKDIYNPYSLLSSFEKEEIRAYWIATGMSSSVLHLIKNRNWDLSNIENIEVSAVKLMGVDANFMDPTALFYQAGYLTIKGYDPETLLYRLGIPNREVRESLFEVIIPHYLGSDIEADQETLNGLFKLMKDGKAKEMMGWLQTYFSKVPYETKMRLREDKPRAEKDFQFVTYAIFSQVCDFNHLHLEYSNSAGRSDLVVDAGNYIYIIEFKLGGTARKALEQIEEKGYALPWQSSGKKVFKIGCTFSARSKGLLQFKIAQ